MPTATMRNYFSWNVKDNCRNYSSKQPDLGSKELLLTDAIESAEYKNIKAECENKILRLEAKLKESNETLSLDIDLNELVNKSVFNLKTLFLCTRTPI